MANSSTVFTTLAGLGDTTSSMEIDQEEQKFSIHFWMFLCMSVVGIVLSVMTNTFTIYTLKITESLHETESLLYQALAINDIVSIIGQATVALLFVVKTQRGCMEVFLLTVFVVYVSVVIVDLININRFIMIARPLHHQRLVKPKRLRLILLVGILTTLIFVILIYCLDITDVMKEITCNDKFPRNNAISDLGSLLIMLLPIFAGFVIIMFTSSGILHKALQQTKKISKLHRNVVQPRVHHKEDNPQHGQGNHRAVAANGLKGLKTVGIITFSYFLIWLPFMIGLANVGEIYHNMWFRYVWVAFTFFNTLWNPLLLYISNKPFRKASRKMILKIKATSCCTRI